MEFYYHPFIMPSAFEEGADDALEILTDYSPLICRICVFLKPCGQTPHPVPASAKTGFCTQKCSGSHLRKWCLEHYNT